MRRPEPPQQTIDEYLDSLRERFDRKRNEYGEEYALETFRSVDVDGSGNLDRSEFRALCLKLDPTLSSQVRL